MKRWYEFHAQTKGAEIVVYDEIGAFGVPAKAFVDELKALGPVAELTVRINSPGGSVFDGVAIYNALKRHDAPITVWIDGIAASIASMIAMAGDEVVMPENAMLMVHDPSGLVVGTATDMRGMAEALDRMKAGMVAAYRDKSGRDEAEIEALMTAETWLSAQEARALCRWHFQPGGGPEYCGACRDDGLPCARGEPGADGRRCPYREHALISRQEHETWDVLLACQGQLRLASSGRLVGIDMDAALKIGAARGCDLAALSELLPAAEAGLVEALCADADRPH